MVKKILKAAVFVMVLAMILSFAGIINAEPDTHELTSQDKVILTQPSVCFVTTYYWGYVLDPWNNTWSNAYYWAFAGTGFCVNPDTGHIVTAGHNVEISAAEFKYDLIGTYLNDNYNLDDWTDADWNWAYENTKVEGYDGGDYDMEVYVQFNTANAGIPDDPGNFDTFIRAELIDHSGFEQRDIAILKIQPQTGRALSSVLIGDSSSVEIQDSLTIIGYPWTSDIGQSNVLNPTITNGSISGKIMLGGTEVLQIQGDARPGNSGGPVLSQNGEVMGILTMGTDDTNNYLRPANDVMEMLKRNGVTNKLGMVDDEFKQGLVNYRLKHFSKAIEHFNAVLNLNQRHLQAQDYRSKAQEAINKGEDVPIEEKQQTVEIVEPETAETEAASETADVLPGEKDESSRAGLPTWAWLLIGCGGFVFIILMVVIIILVARKKRAPAVPTAAAAPAAAPKAEPQKAKAEEKKTASKGKFCPNCGSQINDGVKFCSSCGNKIN
ncbi:MAG: trypsin-like peptidase domain-containing protein [Actinomycetia bacterium]|nr:trypsin-like peptidase domain-containing protein [Actinomycetes bacterium]